MTAISKYVALITMIVALAISSIAFAQTQENDQFYCKERKLGTWFYCVPPKKEESKEAASKAALPSATEQIDAIAEQLDELKARAILQPTTENLTAYMRYQREQLDRASTFADQWSRAVWQNPDLDYTIQRPINALGKKTWANDRKDRKEGLMASLSQRYGLFYFYSSTCSACRVYSPLIRAMSDQYGLEVLAVSMDGGPMNNFRNLSSIKANIRKWA